MLLALTLLLPYIGIQVGQKVTFKQRQLPHRVRGKGLLEGTITGFSRKAGKEAPSLVHVKTSEGKVCSVKPPEIRLPAPPDPVSR